MKKIIFFSITLFILMCSEYAKGQVPQPCNPDCFYTPFSAPQERVYDMTPAACTLHVWYSYRFACSTYYDVQIVKIETIGDDCWRYMPLDKLFKTAYYELIEENPMNFPPYNPPDPPGVACNEQWRISMASCWFTFQISVLGQTYTYTMPCIGTDCCLQPMRICRYTGGSVSISPLDDPWGGDCDEAQAPEPWQDSVCTGHCNWYLFEDELIQPNDDSFKNDSMIPNKQENVTVLKSNILPVLIDSPKQVDYLIRITNNYGGLLLEQRGRCLVGENEINMNFNDLPSGNYIYTIIIDGMEIITKKVILEK